MTREEIEAELAELKGKPGRKSAATTARITELEAELAEIAEMPPMYADSVEAATTTGTTATTLIIEDEASPSPINFRLNKCHRSIKAGIVAPFPDDTPEALAWWTANHPAIAAELYTVHA